jgi:hypothetical protein
MVSEGGAFNRNFQMKRAFSSNRNATYKAKTATFAYHVLYEVPEENLYLSKLPQFIFHKIFHFFKIHFQPFFASSFRNLSS